MPDSETKAFHISVRGRVQGVGFRYSAARAARSLGVRGWVRNMPDSTVELFCEGEPSAVDRFISWLAQGPPGSAVRRVEKRPAAVQGTYRSFSIEY
ncbi:MAG: acylphosphatase [Spirochaetales bacterium]|jgi:acylphosphatase|nr:acylphosphatase [Spirochaetales bacterium]